MRRITQNWTEVVRLKVGDEVAVTDSWFCQSRARYWNSSWHNWRSRSVPASSERGCSVNLLLSIAPERKLALR